MLTTFLQFIVKYRKIIFSIAAFFIMERVVAHFPAWFALAVLLFAGCLFRPHFGSFLSTKAVGCLLLLGRMVLGLLWLFLIVTLFLKVFWEVF